VKVGDRVRVRASGLTGTIESTVEDDGESFYNLRYDLGATERATGSPDVHVSVGFPAGELEPAPESAQEVARPHTQSASLGGFA
jgi:hypothetical protein